MQAETGKLSADLIQHAAFCLRTLPLFIVVLLIIVVIDNWDAWRRKR
jgi:hypothetical protein